MAKRSKRKTRVLVDEKTSRTRALYAQAIAQGYSVVEASKYANSGGSVQPKNESVAVVEPDKVAVDGKAETGNPLLKNLSPNWRTEMLWGQMRKLAIELAPEETVRSRTDAIAIIEQALKDDNSAPPSTQE